MTHGHATRLSRSLTYNSWANMITRCHNPAREVWPRYGGRGIVVCDRWRSFPDFLADMGPRPSPRHSIERMDNDRSYEPGNCAWAIPSVQSRNTRHNRLLTFAGQTRCVTDWAAVIGKSRRTILSRLRYGWSVERALTTL